MMSRKEPAGFTPFDQGVFLVHLNKGREAYKANDLEGARLEMEIALKYRPEEEDLLNLLGMVYFKLRMFSEAEVIYKRLIQKNPDVFILRSNLGLILFKTGRMDEAFPHFKRAIELKPNFVKAHLYLGMIYRKKGKFGLALEHFTFAQAGHYIKEMEEALARQRESAPASASQVSEAGLLDLPPIPAPRPLDTAEITTKFPTLHGRGAETTQPIPTPKREPEGRPLRGMVETVHQEASEAPEKIDLTLRPGVEGLEKRFVLHPNGFLEVQTPRRVFIKKSALRSYTGNIRFSAVQSLHATSAHQLQESVGAGRIFLFEKNHQTYLFELNQEFVYVEGSHILAMEENLAFRYEPIHEYKNNRKLESFKIYGRGALALLTHVEPLTLRVTQDYPLTILSNSLVAWTGHLYPSVVDEEAVSEGPAAFTIRFEGEGIIIADEVL